MRINDRIYGEFEITESVLIDLINSPSMQRLKKISQFGMPDEYYFMKGYSRYDHCVGVMLLLRKLGAELKEQIAGLLHDVSHTAFSHVIDWVIGDPLKENYQDEVFAQFIENSEIPNILDKYNFNYKEICKLDNFSLLENELPNICADRVDYSLREIIDFETLSNFKTILDSLINHRGKIVFNSVNAAEIFGMDFARCQREHWAGAQAKARYHVLAGVLKNALSQNIIQVEDFWKTDKDVIDKLICSGQTEILSGLELLKKRFEVRESSGANSIILKKKFRYVDPYILMNGSLLALSEVSENYKHSLEIQKQESKLINSMEIIAK